MADEKKGEEKKEEVKKLMRTVNFEVYFKDDEKFKMKNAIMEDIWTYRRACGSVAGFLYMLEFAVAERDVSKSLVTKVLPNIPGVNNSVLAKILGATTGFDKKSAIYDYTKRYFEATPVSPRPPKVKEGETPKPIPEPWTTAPWLMDFVCGVQRIIEKRWFSKDADIPQCRRNWLTLNY